MNRRTSAWFAPLLLFCVGRGDAAVFERDWKAPGDGLLTYDDVNQRVWLDLSVSQLTQFPEPRLANAVAEIAPGGLFEGFVWAKRDDVIGLVLSAGIDPTTHDYTVNGSAATNLIDLLSPTVQIGSSIRSVGMIDENFPFGGSSLQFGANIFARIRDNAAGIEVLSELDDSISRTTSGLMLYRVVPEPTSVLASIVAFCMLMLLIHRVGKGSECKRRQDYFRPQENSSDAFPLSRAVMPRSFCRSLATFSQGAGLSRQYGSS